MLLSTWFLDAKYNKVHIQSALVCLVGLAMLIWGDTMGQDGTTGRWFDQILHQFSSPTQVYINVENHSWIGDVICVSAAVPHHITPLLFIHLGK